MNKEEFLKAIENVPKTDSINSISAYNSINVEDLANAVERFKKIPTYDELLKENQELKKQLEDANEKIILLQASEPMLEWKKELEENQQKEFIEYLENEIKERNIQIAGYHPTTQLLIEQIIETEKKVLSKYKEIIGVSK